MDKLSYLRLEPKHETNENQEIDTERFRMSGTHQWFPHKRKPFFRMRCRAILLKAEGLSASQVGEQTEITAQTVGSWVKRFESEGIKGLYTRPGQGRKAIMDCSDEEAVRKAIESDRQSVVQPKKLGRML